MKNRSKYFRIVSEKGDGIWVIERSRNLMRLVAIVREGTRWLAKMLQNSKWGKLEPAVSKHYKSNRVLLVQYRMNDRGSYISFILSIYICMSIGGLKSMDR